MATTGSSFGRYAPNPTTTVSFRGGPIVPTPDQSAAETARLQSKSASVESKTVLTNVDPAKTTASNASVGQNVLHKFRSFNYNFTLAGLPKSKLADPTSYRGTSNLDLIILRSGGKGASKMNITSSLLTSAITPSNVSAGGGRGGGYVDRNYGQEFIDGFNKDSPGQFDMFIDNVQMHNTFSFSDRSSTTLLTNITFDVHEPYSINGFLESLQVAAIASGYASYVQASFLLKMQFTGYPDGAGMPDAVGEIDGCTRYIVLQFTKVEVEVTEEGTKYKCEAVPFEQRSYGETTNQLTKSLQLQGETVKDILENFMKGVEAQVAESNKDSKTENKNLHDSYEVKFPTYDPVNGFDYTKENKIASSKVAVSLEDNKIYSFVDPQKTDVKNAYKVQKPTQAVTTSTTTVQTAATVSDKGNTAVVVFQSEQAIHECIASVVRDSEYIRTFLKSIGQADDNPDQFGMVKYFLVRLEVIPKAELDTNKKRPYQTYRYIVSEYKVHYTLIPNYGSAITDVSKYTSKAVRKYDYLYTGNNLDVIQFKLKFDYLYFEAVPTSQGNNDRPSSQVSAKPAGGTDIKQTGTDKKVIEQAPVPMAQTAAAPSYTNSNASGGAGGQQQRDDPYWNMARAMHESVINSKASLLSGEIEILGDPIFLVAGGTGNYAPKPSQTNTGQTADGEVAHLEGEVIINIGFRNPLDINNLANGGTIKFSKVVPFSGYYKVLNVTSTFKEGVFKQVLSIIRIPGQLDQNSPSTIVATDVTSVVDTTAKAGDSVQADSTKATDSPPPGSSVSQFLLADATANLPGVSGLKIGSITGLVGGLTGAATSLASGLRLSASGLKLGSTDLSVSSSPYSLTVPSVTGLTSNLTGRLTSAVTAGTTAAQGLTSSLTSAAATAQNLTGSLTGNLTSALGSVQGLAGGLTGKLNDVLATGSALSADAIAAASQGLDLTSFPKAALANIPPIQPLAIAADALPDPAIVATAVSNFTVPAVSDISKIGNTVAQKFGSIANGSNPLTSIANAASPLTKLITSKG